MLRFTYRVCTELIDLTIPSNTLEKLARDQRNFPQDGTFIGGIFPPWSISFLNSLRSLNLYTYQSLYFMYQFMYFYVNLFLHNLAPFLHNVLCYVMLCYLCSDKWQDFFLTLLRSSIIFSIQSSSSTVKKLLKLWREYVKFIIDMNALSFQFYDKIFLGPLWAYILLKHWDIKIPRQTLTHKIKEIY